MKPKETFEFLNSLVWIKHTHENYRTPEEIQYRAKEKTEPIANWKEVKTQIIALRKTNSIPMFVNTLNKKFWFFLSDCINKKSMALEKRGTALHQKIVQNGSFKEEFFLDSTIEEAITSAIYEGANSTRSKAQELITSGSAPKNKDEWMLVNNYQAMLWIKENRHREVSRELIEQLHAVVTRNTLEGDDANYQGKFRNDTVFVRSSTGKVKHEGTKYDLIESSLKEVIDLTTKNARFFPPVLKGVLLHYFTAYIHPFFDGNGRTARALFYFKAMKNNLSFIELLSVSAYLKVHGPQYEKSYEKVVGNELDITYFIDFNLDALLHAISEVEKKVDYLLSIRSLKPLLKGISDNQIGLIQRLALNKFRKTNIEEYSAQINMSREIARQELKQLCGWNLLAEKKAGKKFEYQIRKKELDAMLVARARG